MKILIALKRQILGFTSVILLTAISLSASAHILGLSWKDMGDNVVRFYAETAHDGVTDVSGGVLQIGNIWPDIEYYAWTGIINDTSLAELGVDDLAYWDPDDPNSLLNIDNYDTHNGGADSYGNFFYVDVPDFVSGEYMLLVQSCCTALERQLADTYLVANIHVPEPPVWVLFAMGMLAVSFARSRHKRQL